MAQRSKVILVEDLDGTPAVETVPFGVDGRHYEIDLSDANAKQLRKEMKAYIGKARTIAPMAPRQEAAAIRRWAKEHGYEVSAPGRLHRDMVDAYNQAARK